jgi:phosphoglycerate dehydrogenase-like enzyme
VPPDRIAEVLPRTQWLVLCAPLTARTRGMIGADALGLMPEGAYILNVARGPLIDEGAVIASLQSGHLGGAYLECSLRSPYRPSRRSGIRRMSS